MDKQRREHFLHCTTTGDAIPTGDMERNQSRGTKAGGLPIDTSAGCLPVPIVELR